MKRIITQRSKVVLALTVLLAVGMTALSASVALAQVAAGTYPGSVVSANAPGSSHLASGTIACVVEVDLDVVCSAYVLGGVGHTNAAVSLAATYSATIDCTNHGGNLVESHTSEFTDSSTAAVASTKNGQLSVPERSASPFSAPQVCPNPNWTPSIRAGTLVLEEFTYTLTFAGFTSPAVTISEP
jgi:glycerol uptake facilitator-like aquaporin